MLNVVYDGVNSQNSQDTTERDDAWIIFNQDDAKWRIDFRMIYERLSEVPSNVTRFDISRQGLVCVAFKARFLAEIVQKTEQLCDFVPVDWMVWSFEDDRHATEKVPIRDDWITHIGKVSSRNGLVSDPPTGDRKEPRARINKRAPIKRLTPEQKG